MAEDDRADPRGLHLLRSFFRYAARQGWDKTAKLPKSACRAATEDVAIDRFAEFADTWGKKYLAVVRFREKGWEEFTLLLDFATEIRRIVCTANAIESVNARIRRAVKAGGHLPNEQAAALKCVYMAIMSLDPTGKDQARWTMRWKTALKAFDIAFDARLRSPTVTRDRTPASGPLHCRRRLATTSGPPPHGASTGP